MTNHLHFIDVRDIYGRRKSFTHRQQTLYFFDVRDLLCFILFKYYILHDVISFFFTKSSYYGMLFKITKCFIVITKRTCHVSVFNVYHSELSVFEFSVVFLNEIQRLRLNNIAAGLFYSILSHNLGRSSGHHR